MANYVIKVNNKKEQKFVVGCLQSYDVWSYIIYKDKIKVVEDPNCDDSVIQDIEDRLTDSRVYNIALSYGL